MFRTAAAMRTDRARVQGTARMTYLERLSSWRRLLPFLVRVLALAATGVPALAAETQGIEVPTGQAITPTAAAGALFQDLNPGQAAAPALRAGQAAALAVSPSGETLAILTSGYNKYYDHDGMPVPELSTEYVFLFDISGHEPRQIQVLPLANTFEGLAWSPGSDRLFVSTGSDDTIVEFVRSGSRFEKQRSFHLGHMACLGIPESPGYGGVGKRKCGPVVAGLAVSPDGTRLLAANIQNDSVSLIDLTHGDILAEQDLRPGIIDPRHHGQPGGSFPRSLVWVSSEHGYVASERDRELISLRISHDKIRVLRRVPVDGQPIALVANRSGSRVYVALDTTSQVSIIDTNHDKVIETLNVTAPESVYAIPRTLGGANTDALTLTPDERTLLVSNGGQNSVAVVRLGDRARDEEALRERTAKRADHENDDDDTPDAPHSAVIGLVPTGRYPTGVATSKDGSTWYVINYKSETGPSAPWCAKSQSPSPGCLPQGWAIRPSDAENPFDDKNAALRRSLNLVPWALQKAGLLTLPAPGALDLARLTQQVAHNNHFDRPEKAAADEKLFAFLHSHIKHVIYIIKENKTYDEVLGDLEIGDGDPRLTLFPERLTPNHHSLARNFVTLDNFLVPGAGSWTGWDWSVSAQTNDFRERLETLASANSGFTSFPKRDGGLEGEPGINRNINMAYATSAERRRYDSTSPADPDILPGARDVAAPDGPGGAEGKGYLWQAALRRGVSVRNWGFFGGFFTNTADLPLVRDAYAQKLRVFFPTRPSLMAYSDPYYRSFDPALPDYWRVQEWKREFTEFSQKHSAPQLMLMQLGNDHTGDFARALDGVNTPDTQVADNDYALGLIVEAVAQSTFAKDTLIIAVEDDPLGGFDHADAFRSVALFAGPYVRQHAVVSTRYTTVSIVKTIEEILGLEPIGLNDALAAPVSDIFDPTMTTWSYQALVPGVLRSTALPLPPASHACNERPRGSSSYWAQVMADQDFSEPDRVDAASFTRTLWRGLNGNARYPIAVTGKDLRESRAALLSRLRAQGADLCN